MLDFLRSPLVDSKKSRSHSVRARPVRARQILARVAALETLEQRRLMSVVTWTGTAGDGNWATASNWQGGAAPVVGDDVVFPATSGPNLTDINVPAGVSINSITMHGSYMFNGGSAISLTDLTEDGGSQDAFNIPVTLTSNATFNIADYAIFYATIGEASPGTDLTLVGGGYGNFRSGPLSYTGTTDINDGTMLISGATSSSNVVIDGQGKLEVGVNGTVPAIDFNGGDLQSVNDGNAGSGGTVDNNFSVPSNTTLFYELNKQNGTTLDPTTITVNTGQITLNDPVLSLVDYYSFTQDDSDSLTLIQNNTGNPIVGTFASLPQGSLVSANGHNYTISYDGGSNGQDVVITALPATDVWTGSAGDGNWSTAGNWQGGAAPLSTQNADFPSLGSSTQDISLSSNVTVANITMEGNYHFANDAITLNGDINASDTDDVINSELILAQNTAFNIDSSDQLTVNTIDDGGGHYSIDKQGQGTLIINGSSNYTGNTETQQGVLNSNAQSTSPLVVDSGTEVYGNGSAAGLNVGSGGTLALSDGTNPQTFTSGGNVGFTSGATLDEYVAPGSTPGTEVDGKLTATGTAVNLSGATLAFSLPSSYEPSSTDAFTLISNQTSTAVTGTFNNLPEGAQVSVGGREFIISYVGGTSGKDVTLTAVAPLSTSTTPTVASVMGNVVTPSVRPTLRILGADTATAGESGLTYTWSVTHAPTGARAAIFSDNGNNAAKDATVRLPKDGTYDLQCVITNTAGHSVSKTVQIVEKQVARSLRLSPHAQTLSSGSTQQFSAVALDQFGHPMRAAAVTKFAILTGSGTITPTGLFTAGVEGHVLIQIGIDGLLGVVGATVT